MTNLLLTLLDKVGVHADTLGDSTGRMPRSDRSGVRSFEITMIRKLR